MEELYIQKSSDLQNNTLIFILAPFPLQYGAATEHALRCFNQTLVAIVATDRLPIPGGRARRHRPEVVTAKADGIEIRPFR